jgi:hypothetical protein
MREAILDALQAKYEAQIQEALVNIEVYLTNPAGIGEHSEIIEAIDGQVSKMAEAAEKKQIIRNFY